MHFLKILRVTPLCLFLFYSILLEAQEITISGKVSSEEGPLAGVNVMVQGTTHGTITDIDGNYTLEITNRDAVLIFSFVGYRTTLENVGSQSEINVFMQYDATQLEEVIVTGYTAQSARNITGSISRLTPKDMENVNIIPESSVLSQLQGRLPGVNVIYTGRPGDAENTSVRIRGYTTLNDNNPLYIIDGMPDYGTTAYNLNPYDIESILALKDAAAASIYGTRAANGVILINTKNGRLNDGVNLSFDSYVGVQYADNFPELLNSQEMADITKIAMENAGMIPYHAQYSLSVTDSIWGLPDYIMPAGYSIELNGPLDESTYDPLSNPITIADQNGTNWFDEIFQPALLQNYNLIVSGGSSNAQYSFSLGYFNQEGVIIHTGYERFTIRFNSVFHIKDWLRIGENIGISFNRTQNQNYREGSHNSIRQALSIASLRPVFDINENFTGTRIPQTGAENPVAELERGKDNNAQNIDLYGSIFLVADLVNGLTFKTNFSPNFRLTYEDKIFVSEKPEDQFPATNSLKQTSCNRFNWAWYNTLRYQKTFRNDHNIDILFGMEAINQHDTYFDASRNNYSLENLDYRHLNSGGVEGIQNSGESSEWSIFSLFTKLDYNYHGKYLASLTLRRDGSSKFGNDKRYAFFPAFSIGWRLSNEIFMSSIRWLNDLKFRASWGQSGNHNIGNYRIYNSYRSDMEYASYGITGDQHSADLGYRFAVFGNPDFGWETSTSINIGMDIGLFENQLSLSFDWFNRLTTDMLMEVSQPATIGQAKRPYENIGEMRNTGYELSIHYQNRTTKKFRFNIGLNLSYYKNEVTKLNDQDSIFYMGWLGFLPINGGTSIIKEGYPINTYYGYKILGIFQNASEVASHANQGFTESSEGIGRWKFEDVNDDGVINDNDRTALGNPHPVLTFGIPMYFSYSNFDMTMFWYGSWGNEIYNYTKRFTDFYNTTDISAQNGKRILQSWGLKNISETDAILPQVTVLSPDRETDPNTYFIEDGSYLRLKQLIIGYNFKTSKWKGVDKFRVYLQINNLITFTKYLGMDPMVAGKDFFGSYYDNTGIMRLGVDEGDYPVSKVFILGLNFTF